MTAPPDYWPLDRFHDREILITLNGTLRVVVREPREKMAAYNYGYRRSIEDFEIHRFNVKSRDPAYWRSVRAFLRWIELAIPRGHRFAATAYKELRKLRHESQAKEWEQALPSAIVEWAGGEIMRQIRNEELDCPDNSRVARVGNSPQMRRFKRQRASGCCGCSEWYATAPDGKVYLLGLNYGH